MELSKDIITEIRGRVLYIRLNRPQTLNALSANFGAILLNIVQDADLNPDIGCVLITGNERAFSAGADISELYAHTSKTMYEENVFAEWDLFARVRIPKIAVVRGYTLGGGCELAMMCDFIIASETAVFGQPEVKIGCIPGMGGTQRLTRLVGKCVAMDMILTGKMIDASEALRIGLVSRVIKDAEIEDASIAIAQTIAGYSKDIVMLARSCVLEAEETHLSSGMRYERHAYHMLYGNPAQKAGMLPFVKKRE